MYEAVRETVVHQVHSACSTAVRPCRHHRCTGALLQRCRLAAVQLADAAGDQTTLQHPAVITMNKSSLCKTASTSLHCTASFSLSQFPIISPV